jgi:eukaryotic-like serine/threonine-protein kinase
MDDPKQKKYEPEAPTLVPDGGVALRLSDPGAEAPTLVDISPATRIPSAPTAPPTAGLVSPPTMLGVSDVAPGSTWDGNSLLGPGAVLANRYEIIKILGEGGMGAVYKAKDLELEREVALKLIKPELANHPEILQRFKQELILARQITDRNVIRIFDIGEAAKTKFITMEYMEGEDLHRILKEKGKLDVAEAVDIMEQVASGLAAAHREGIIHRDLKPGNIMRDTQGRVVVMDFGLARTVGGDGMTRTGAMLGTIEYMSPEQAQGQELKASSDIFTFGLILYELLAGVTPFYAESAIASLLMRTTQRAIPLADVNKNVPGSLSNIVSKCLEKEPANRYQSAEELVTDLRAWQGKGGSKTKISASAARLRFNRLREIPWPRIAVAIVLIVAVVAGTVWYMIRRQQAAKTVVHAPVSVLVADFQNQTGDSLFDDTLEPMFNVALEGASFINAANRGTARQSAAALPNGTQKLDEQASRLVAVKEGIAAIVTGILSKNGSGYTLAIKAIDAVTGNTLADTNVNATSKDDLLLQVPKLAVPIRQALGDTTPKSVQLGDEQGTLSTSSLEALHQYSLGMEQQAQGKLGDALGSFTKASQLDPNFARAYSGMAAASGNLGKLPDAQKYAKLAMEHVDRMTERERYRIRGMYYVWSQNWQKCTEEYGELVKQYPADNIGHSNLAACYAQMLDMPKATEEARRSLEITPNNITARMNVALYSCYATDFTTCEQGAQKVLQLNPSYEEGFLVLAYSQLGQNHLTDAAATYQKLAKISDWGSSIATSGLGDLALYQGRFREAAQILEKGAAQEAAAKKTSEAADKLLMLSYANLTLGQKAQAIAAADRAAASEQSAKVRFMAARTYVEAGDTAKAQKLATALGAEIQTTSQAYSKLILGEIALQQKSANQAIQFFTDASKLSDTWIGRFDMGRAYLQAGAYIEADGEFDRCIKRRGEALELFMDDVPTYSYLPAVYYGQGKAREGLQSPGYADSYRTYLSIRGQSTDDPQVSELKRKVSQ